MTGYGLFVYYLHLALRSLRLYRVLTALMVLAIAMGIGASMTTLTVLHVLSRDPLPTRSGQLFVPQIDPYSLQDYQPGDPPPDQVTWTDGMNLLKAARADRQVLMTGSDAVVEPDDPLLDPFFAPVRSTTADFFAMFDTRFIAGHGWNAADDESAAHVVVISRSLNQRVFHGENSIGRPLRLRSTVLRVIGIVEDWNPQPRFYDLNAGHFGGKEDIFVPLATSRQMLLTRRGSVECWGRGAGDNSHMEQSTCVWLQFWVQLSDASKVSQYKSFLQHYSQEQKQLGRFEREPNVRLLNIVQWLDDQQVVPNDVRLQTWLAFGFLLVCLVNTVGLMLAKFLRRSGELGVRRALGASRLTIFSQLLIEAGLVGLAGGVVGLLLAALGLWLVRQQPAKYAALAHMDASMLVATFVLALTSALCAGLLPAWRACQVAPALQLKSS